MEGKEPLLITPKTKVGELLDHYPQLEPVLMELSPVFKKLKNPILRRTVSRVASLQQAASLGNLAVGDLINALRARVGQEQYTGNLGEGEVNHEQPSWFDPQQIAAVFDASPLIDSGQNPMNEIIRQLKGTKTGKIFHLVTPFVPAPIIGLLTEKGYEHYCRKSDDQSCSTFFLIPGS